MGTDQTLLGGSQRAVSCAEDLGEEGTNGVMGPKPSLVTRGVPLL